MLSEMILSAVPDPEYEDLVAHNPVDDQIGPDNHELTGMRQPAFSAAVRKSERLSVARRMSSTTRRAAAGLIGDRKS